MTGREEPSARELHENLERRVLQIEGPEMLEKRYNRHGVPKTASTSTSKTALAKSGSSLAANNFRGNGNNKHSGNAAGSQQQGSGSQQQGSGASQQQQGSAQQQGAASATVAPDPVAQADTPADSDSLGLDIEYVTPLYRIVDKCLIYVQSSRCWLPRHRPNGHAPARLLAPHGLRLCRSLGWCGELPVSGWRRMCKWLIHDLDQKRKLTFLIG